MQPSFDTHLWCTVMFFLFRQIAIGESAAQATARVWRDGEKRRIPSWLTLLSGEKEDFGGGWGWLQLQTSSSPVSAGVRKELNGAESISRSGGAGGGSVSTRGRRRRNFAQFSLFSRRKKWK